MVGNLNVGGSGKSPVIEYLIRLLKDRYRIAVLSRGYGRSGSGFIRTGHEAVSEISASLIGDEPYQYFSRFRDITVAVDADRVAAIERLEDDHDLILLDDAFQNRRLKPGFSDRKSVVVGKGGSVRVDYGGCSI